MKRIHAKKGGGDSVEKWDNSSNRKSKIAKIDDQQQHWNKQRKTFQLPIPGETWELVLGWLSHDHLASSTCFVLGLVGAFSMRILHVKWKRKLGPITLDWRDRAIPNPNRACTTTRESTRVIGPQLHANGERIALPKCPVSDSVVGFEHIQLRYFNQEVLLLFMRRMRPLLHNVNIILNFQIRKSETDSMTALAHVLPLCSSVNSLTTRLGNLCELNLQHPRLLQESRLMVLTFNQLPAVNRLAVLGQWLTTPLADGAPKLVIADNNRLRIDDLQEVIRNHVLSAAQSAKFLMYFPGFRWRLPEELVVNNTATGDRFCAYKRTKVIDWHRESHWFMRCCPIAEHNTPKWLALEEKLIDYYQFESMGQVLEFYVDKIGPIDVSVQDDEDGQQHNDAEAEEAFDADVAGTSAAASAQKKRI